LESIIEFSHNVLIRNLPKDSIILDMTVGNGKDTLFLVNNFKYVYGFDIQEIAINKAKELLKDYNNYTLICDSHLNFDKYVLSEFSGAIFNLGYLPGGNKEIHTEAEIVLETLKKIFNKISKGGIVVIVFYPGFASGKRESEIVYEFLKNLDQKEFAVVKYEFVNQINNPPWVVAVKVI